MNKKDKHIKPGYRLTEVGIIPVDWELKTYGEVFSFLNTAQYSRDELSENGDVLYLHYGDIHVKFSNKLDVGSATLPTISETQLKKYSLVKDGDLIMADASEDYNGIGKSIEVFGLDKKKLISGLHTFLMRDNQGRLVNGFRGYLHENKAIKTQFDRLATGLKVYGVSKNNLKKVIIPVPNKSEQSAIAQALSDTDTLISSLDELIEKKKSIKQGAMQELLTGKRRLPGFNGKWVRKKLGDIGNFTGSGVDKTINPEEIPVKLINYLDVFHRDFIYKRELYHLVTATKEKTEKCNVKKGDIFFTPSSEMPYDIGISAVAMEDMDNVVYSYHIDRLRLEDDWDLLFRAYIFQTKDFAQQASTQCEGGGKRYVLSLTAFRERLTVLYPIDKNEQSAIGKTLFDMDNQIWDLEKKRDKYKQIKQGMMSELLTGNIRLLGVK